MLLSNYRILQLVELPDKVFADAQVTTGIFVLQKESSQARSQTMTDVVHTVVSDQGASYETFRKIPQRAFHSTFQNVFDLSISPETELIKEKMRQGPSIGSLYRVCFGLKTGDDEKYIHKTRGLHKEDKPLLRGEDVKRYAYEYHGEYVWYVPEKMRVHRSTARPGDSDRFEQAKLLVKDTTTDFAGTFDDRKFYVKDVLIVIPREGSKTSPDLRYVTGIINSAVLKFYYRTTFKTLHVQAEELASLPLPRLDLGARQDVARHDRLVRLVDQMLDASRALAEARTDRDKAYYRSKCATIDHNIDDLVYELYGLAREEVEQVEQVLEA